MHKHLRKLGAILAAIMLAVSLHIPAAFAAEETASCPRVGCGRDCTIKRVPATCTSTGTVYYVCPEHGDVPVSTIPISHKYRDVEDSYVAPTCTQDGTMDQQCTDCGRKKTVVLYDALGHDLSHVAAREPLGETDGNREYWKCERCGAVFLDADGKTSSTLEEVTLPGHRHTLKMTPAKDPTETTPGNILFYTCQECGKYFTDEAGTIEIALSDAVLPRLDHDLTRVPAKDATEDAPGNISYYECTRGCGKLFADAEATREISLADTVIPPLGHNLKHIAGKAATDEEDGVLEHWKCQDCGKLFSDKDATDEIQDTVIPALGHDLEKIEGADATEDAPGNIPYWRCKRCGKLFADKDGKTEISLEDTVIPIKAHEHALEHVAGKAATDEEDGVLEHWKCQGCGKLFSDKDATDEIQDTVIPALGHDLEKIEGSDATEDAPGNIPYWRCKRCGKLFADKDGKTEISLEDTVIPIKAHEHALKHAAGKAASDEEDGVLEHWKCQGCGKLFSDEAATDEIADTTIPALGHDLEKIEGADATEDAPGNIPYWRCKRCGKLFADKDGTTEISLEDTVIPVKAHEHTLEHVAGKAASDEEDGVLEHWKCQGCGKLFSDKDATDEIQDTVIPALGHDLEKIEGSDATEDAPGNLPYWRCKRCGKLFADKDGKTEISLEDTVIPVKAHEHALEHVAGKAASDEEDGVLEHWKCQGCGKLFSDKDATKEIQDTVIPALGHDLEKVDGQDATEDAPGNLPYWRCKRCGKLFADKDGKKEITLEDTVIPAKEHEHTLERVPGFDATDEEDGVLEHWKCEGCGKLFADKDTQEEISDTVLPARGHDLKYVEGTDPTEDAPGNLPYWKCARCGKCFADKDGAKEVDPSDLILEPLAHTHKLTLVPGKDPTETEAGVKQHYVCEGCGKLFEDEAASKELTSSDVILEPLGHSLTEVPGKDPTETESGTRRHWKCDHCGKLFADSDGKQELSPGEIELPALGHDLIRHEGYEPTEGKPGRITYWECARCGKLFADAEGTKEIKLEDTILEAEHTHEWQEMMTAPSCTQGGFTTLTCSVCGETKRENETAELGHKLTAVEAKEPTLTEDGNIAYWKCETCGELFADEDGKVVLKPEDVTLEKLPGGEPTIKPTASPKPTQQPTESPSPAPTQDPQIPTTDDETNLAMYLWICAISGGIIAAMIFALRRRRKQNRRG